MSAIRNYPASDHGSGIAWVVHPLLSLLVPGLWLCIAVHATNTV
jgi:hypothetical protein